MSHYDEQRERALTADAAARPKPKTRPPVMPGKMQTATIHPLTPGVHTAPILTRQQQAD